MYFCSLYCSCPVKVGYGGKKAVFILLLFNFDRYLWNEFKLSLSEGVKIEIV